MKGLVSVPASWELEKCYQHLLHGRPTWPGPADLALYSQWCRFDPRLGEIWVGYVFRHWQELHPTELRKRLLAQPWPQVAGVLLEFVRRQVQKENKPNLPLFDRWKELVCSGFGKADFEQFYIGLRRIAGPAMLEDARFSLEEYRRWGYLARETLFNKQRLPGKMSAETRREILKNLLASRSRLTVQDYWDMIGRTVSRRQAERDLMASRLLRATGNTRGRIYRKR